MLADSSSTPYRLKRFRQTQWAFHTTKSGVGASVRVFCRVSISFQPQRTGPDDNIIPMLAPVFHPIFLDCQWLAFAPPLHGEKRMKARSTCMAALSVAF